MSNLIVEDGLGAARQKSLEQLAAARSDEPYRMFGGEGDYGDHGEAAYELIASELGCDALTWYSTMGEPSSRVVCELSPASMPRAIALARRSLLAAHGARCSPAFLGNLLVDGPKVLRLETDIFIGSGEHAVVKLVGSQRSSEFEVGTLAAADAAVLREALPLEAARVQCECSGAADDNDGVESTGATDGSLEAASDGSLEAAAAAQASLEASLARKEAVIQVDLRAVADASAAKKAWEAAGYEKLPVEDESVAYLSKTF